MGPALQVFERLQSHSFGTVRDRPVDAGEGTEVGDGAQIGPDEPDLRLLFGVASLVRDDILPDRQKTPLEAKMLPEWLGRVVVGCVQVLERPDRAPRPSCLVMILAGRGRAYVRISTPYS